MVVYKYLDEITQAILLIIGGVHKNPGPVTRQNDQQQIITQNVRGMIEFKNNIFWICTTSQKCVQIYFFPASARAQTV